MGDVVFWFSHIFSYSNCDVKVKFTVLATTETCWLNLAAALQVHQLSNSI